MKKTSIYIDDDVDRALTRRARSEGTTKAAIIREALAGAAREPTTRPQARGVFDGPEDLAREADRHLAATAFGER